jgi:hypothetical protein
MFLLQSFMFRDVFVACGQGGLCYARNDSPFSHDIDIAFEAWDLRQSKSPQRRFAKSIASPEGRSNVWFSLPTDFLNGTHVALISTNLPRAPLSSKAQVDPVSTYLWSLPRDLPLELTIGFAVQVEFESDPDSKDVRLDLRSSHLALYVVVSASTAGHFSDNAFPLRPGSWRQIVFQPIGGSDFDRTEFLNSLRVEHLGSRSTLIVYDKGSSSEKVMR